MIVVVGGVCCIACCIVGCVLFVYLFVLLVCQKMSSMPTRMVTPSSMPKGINSSKKGLCVLLFCCFVSQSFKKSSKACLTTTPNLF